MADDDDRLADAKRRVAFEHFGDEWLGDRLRGGNVRQLRADAERLRREAGVPDTGERYGIGAALYLYRERQAELVRRVFGEGTRT
jgi:hypothetical protein